MAIGFRSAGAEEAGTVTPSAAIGLPAGWQVGDLHLLVVNVKPSDRAPSAPAGWNTSTNSSINGGTGVEGNPDQGTNNLQVFWRIAEAGDTAPTVTFAVGVPSPSHAFIVGFTKGAGEAWQTPLTMASASDTAGSTTSYGPVTGNATITFSAGDWIGQATGFNGDAGTPGTRTFAVPGVTLGTYVAHVDDDATVVGGDSRVDIGTAPYSSGTASGAPTYERTWTAAATTFSGATLFFRLRATSGPPTGSATGAWSFVGTAAGTRAPQGSASGSWTFTGTAAGKRTPKGSASGTFVWSGAAIGRRIPTGATTGAVTWAGAAVGVTPVVGRDLTITWGPGRSRSFTAAPRE